MYLEMYEGTQSWADWMIVKPSLEQEFKLESEATAILEDEEHDEIADLCARLSKQCWYQKELIKQATARIAQLETQAMLIEDGVKDYRKQSWLKQWWTLNAAFLMNRFTKDQDV